MADRGAAAPKEPIFMGGAVASGICVWDGQDGNGDIRAVFKHGVITGRPKTAWMPIFCIASIAEKTHEKAYNKNDRRYCNYISKHIPLIKTQYDRSY